MTLNIKPGETLSWSVVDDAGDISGTTIEAALSTDGFYYPLTITPEDLTVGTYQISADDTSSFPRGTLLCDLKYSIAGRVTYTNTFHIEVLKKVTQ